MPKSFDERLKENIVEVFEQHQEPYNPRAFEQFRKIREKGHGGRKLLLWQLAKAAAVLLLILASTQVLDYHTLPQKMMELSLQDNAGTPKGVRKPHAAIETAQPASQSPVRQKAAFTAAPDTLAKALKPRLFRETDEAIAALEQKPANLAGGNLTQKLCLRRKVKDTSSRTGVLAYKKPLPIQEDTPEKRMSYALGVNTNYSFTRRQMSSDLGYSAGMSAKYRIFEHLSLSGGVYYSQQELAYKTSNPLPGHFYMAGRQSLSSRETVTAFQGLEIPVEVSYRFNRLTVATGFSSIVYLHERHVSHYQKLVATATDEGNQQSEISGELTDLSYKAVTTRQKETRQAWQHADFARLLTLSAGYRIPMKTGAVVIEPFIKYPAGRLTSADIRLGFSGIGLRYQFGKGDL